VCYNIPYIYYTIHIHIHIHTHTHTQYVHYPLAICHLCGFSNHFSPAIGWRVCGTRRPRCVYLYIYTYICIYICIRIVKKTRASLKDTPRYRLINSSCKISKNPAPSRGGRTRGTLWALIYVQVGHQLFRIIHDR